MKCGAEGLGDTQLDLHTSHKFLSLVFFPFFYFLRKDLFVHFMLMLRMAQKQRSLFRNHFLWMEWTELGYYIWDCDGWKKGNKVSCSLMHLDCFTKSQLVSQSIWSVRVIFAISLNKKCMSFKTKQQNRTDTILRDSNSLLTKVYLALDSYTSSRCSAYARRYFLLFDVHRWMLGLKYLPYVFFISLSTKKTTNIYTCALQHEYQLWPIEFACRQRTQSLCNVYAVKWNMEERKTEC